MLRLYYLFQKLNTAIRYCQNEILDQNATYPCHNNMFTGVGDAI